MLIFPNLADDRGDRVTAIVRSGWGHATGCMVSQSVQIWRNGRQKKLESFVLHIRTNMRRDRGRELGSFTMEQLESILEDHQIGEQK